MLCEEAADPAGGEDELVVLGGRDDGGAQRRSGLRVFDGVMRNCDAAGTESFEQRGLRGCGVVEGGEMEIGGRGERVVLEMREESGVELGERKSV